MNGHRYTDEEKQFFVMYVPGHSHREIQQEFIKRFGWEITVSQVQGSIKRYNLNTGRNGYFPKGHIPQNKGKKMPPEVYERCKGTMFKKGHNPQNSRPVGSERTNKDGYIEIKIAEPNKWMPKHRFIWQQANGEVPRGHIVVFRDNDRTNVTIENLMLITRKENAVINHAGLSSTIDEAKELAVTYARFV